MECMSEHTGLISSYQLLVIAACTDTRWKAAPTEQLTGAHLYLDIAKSGYLFHGFAGGMTLPVSVIHLSNTTYSNPWIKDFRGKRLCLVQRNEANGGGGMCIHKHLALD